MEYQYMRRMMLNQTWNHEKGYVKLLHFPSSEVSKSFYFTATNRFNFHFGILGKIKQSKGDVNDVIRTIEAHFREAVHSFKEVDQIVEAFTNHMDALHNDIKLSFHLWVRHKDFEYIPVITKGMPEMKLLSRDLEGIVSPIDFELQDRPNFTCTFVPIAQTRTLIFATTASCLPKFTSKHESIFELSKHIHDAIICKPQGLNDEVCILLLDLHDFTVTSESTFYGIENFDNQIESIMSTINTTHDPFAIRLILSELLMNAYKHGNSDNQNLPIKVIVGNNDEELVLEVMDMTIRKDEISIKTELTSENLLEENGRGLFLVNTFSDQFTIDCNSVISRIKTKKMN